MSTPSRVAVAKEESVQKLTFALSVPASGGTISEAMPLARVQGVFGQALRDLNALRNAITEGSAGASSAAAGDGAFWQRRRAECERLSGDLQRAVLARKAHSEAAAAADLMGTAARNGRPLSALSSAAAVTAKASDAAKDAKTITEALRRTHDMMSSTLGQASEARQVLEGDGRLLRGTFDQHRAIGTTVGKASRVLRQIQRQDEVRSPGCT